MKCLLSKHNTACYITCKAGHIRAHASNQTLNFARQFRGQRRRLDTELSVTQALLRFCQLMSKHQYASRDNAELGTGTDKVFWKQIEPINNSLYTTTQHHIQAALFD